MSRDRVFRAVVERAKIPLDRAPVADNARGMTIQPGDSANGSAAADEPAVIDLQSDQYFMGEALRLARRAWAKEEVPVGAVVVREGRIIARAWNQVETLRDATAHAEMLAMTQAESVLDDWRLTDCDLYVTKEPCPMCAGAIVHCRVRRVIYGCRDPKAGAAGGFINLLQHPNLNHRSEITAGVLEEETREILREFFARRRAEGKRPPRETPGA